LNLSFDFAAFFLALLDQRRHAIVGIDEDVDATLQQLALRFLILALIGLPFKLKFDSFNLTDQVRLLIYVAQEKRLILADFALEEVGLAANMVYLVVD